MPAALTLTELVIEDDHVTQADAVFFDWGIDEVEEVAAHVAHSEAAFLIEEYVVERDAGGADDYLFDIPLSGFLENQGDDGLPNTLTTAGAFHGQHIDLAFMAPAHDGPSYQGIVVEHGVGGRGGIVDESPARLVDIESVIHDIRNSCGVGGGSHP